MIVVTGANGFIGSAIVWDLLNHGVKGIIAVDSVSLQERSQLLDSRLISQFLLSEDFLKFLETPGDHQIELVIHMGACSATTEMNRDFLKANNTNYSKTIFNWCTRYRVPLIYASSASVYGDGKLGFSDSLDNRRISALNPYGESKLAFDQWVETQKAHPPRWYGLRFFNVFGPGEAHKGAQASVVFQAFEQIRATGRLRLFRSHNPDYQDGMQKRDFVYIKDIVRWVAELSRAHTPSGIYNMGFGTARTWLDLAAAVFAALKQPMKIEWIDTPPSLQKHYQYFTQAKMAKLRSHAVGFPEWPLEQAASDYIENYLLSKRAHL